MEVKITHQEPPDDRYPFDENEIYSAKEVAYRMGMNREWVRRRFLNEPGVMVIPSPDSGKRVYRSLRIPGWVANRVWREYRV
ncbi:MAG TPA: hypothetical protein VNL91_09975, partial [Thermoanaerobaculia bacterium]|nr:hypothetical protein [Thermoanaerobaculia bacterium]